LQAAQLDHEATVAAAPASSTSGLLVAADAGIALAAAAAA